MNEQIILEIKETLKISEKQVKSVLEMLEEGNTIPFIARYRKEATGGLDEEVINEIYKTFEYQQNLFQRKEDVIRLIDEKRMLTDELKAEILRAQKLVEVEDLYRPYKEKKKTKATEAIKFGLEPLAKWILSLPTEGDLETEAENYLNENVKTTADAITGAKYIIAEMISDNADFRKALRLEMTNDGMMVGKKRKEADTIDEKGLYETYYDYQEAIKSIPSHRILAMNRAENLKVINVSLDANREKMLKYLETKMIGKKSSFVNEIIEDAIKDALRRLIYPSIEREVRSELKEKAEDKAIELFAINLKNLLLQPPMKEQVVMGIDPAFRTGCKFAIVNPQGTVLFKDVIFPHEKYVGEKGAEQRIPASQRLVVQAIKKYHVDIIAIGNGTASRETESFVSEMLRQYKLPTKYVIVDEAGASVYSASELARKEFPDYSVEERSAVSIARRLQDPLSELVKIDPKSIGVGQYQHDVSQNKLSETLDFVVTNAVNQVGVNVNTASEALLCYVSGLDKRISENLVKHRDQHGPFKSREELLTVPRLGPKSYEQAAGFLRIVGGEEKLDMTSIHPESYQVALEIIKLANLTPEMVGSPSVRLLIEYMDRNKIRSSVTIDDYTFNDILDALAQPLRDPRDEFTAPQLRSDILNIEDLQEGMQLEGTVRNVVQFGAFVDCGLKEDGLVHISKMATRFVKDPNEIVSVGDIIKVWVIGVDKVKGKVSLSMIPPR